MRLFFIILNIDNKLKDKLTNILEYDVKRRYTSKPFITTLWWSLTYWGSGFPPRWTK